MITIYCQNCGAEISSGANFCNNCGAPVNSAGESSTFNHHVTLDFNDKTIKKKKPFYKKWWFWVILIYLIISVAGRSATTSNNKTANDAAQDLNSQIDTTEISSKEVPAEPAQTEEPQEELTEINPDIPLGTSYSLGQGTFECGSDIPAGRYLVEWIDGNQFGGTITAKNGPKYLGSFVSLSPGDTYTCILSSGDKFEIALSTFKFTKISSLPNDNYKQADGSYLLGYGIFFEGIDIPEGKYNLTASGGNQFGLTASTRNKSFIYLEQGETYNNLVLDHMGAKIEISLGEVRFDPVS